MNRLVERVDALKQVGMTPFEKELLAVLTSIAIALEGKTTPSSNGHKQPTPEELEALKRQQEDEAWKDGSRAKWKREAAALNAQRKQPQ